MTDFTKLMEYRFQGVKKYNTYISILWSLKFVEKLGAQHDIEILFQSLCHLYDSTLPAKQFRKSEKCDFWFFMGGKQMWHDQGEWVTCRQYSILSFQH